MAILEDPEEHEITVLRTVAPPFAGARVLEVGCGSGRLTSRYRADAGAIIAIDPDANAIAELKDRLPGVTARAVGIEALTLPPHSVDVVLFAWSL